jgi:hypothetical protein
MSSIDLLNSSRTSILRLFKLILLRGPLPYTFMSATEIDIILFDEMLTKDYVNRFEDKGLFHGMTQIRMFNHEHSYAIIMVSILIHWERILVHQGMMTPVRKVFQRRRKQVKN